MIQQSKSKLKLIILASFFSLIIIYGYVTSFDFLRGPIIELNNEPIVNTKESFFTLKGRAYSIATLYLNDRQIFTDDLGYFEESLLLFPGYNILELRAEDNFEREVVQIVEVVLVTG